MSSVSIKEVAARAGVSPGTVSNVLNRPEKVAEATRVRVEEAVRDLGFVRHGSASSLRAGHSRTVGLVGHRHRQPVLHRRGARAWRRRPASAGYAVILGNSSGDRLKEERNLLVFAEQRVRGVLITPAGADLAKVDQLKDRGINVVLVDHPATRADQCSVAVNDVTGGSLAVSHLLAAGADRIAYVTGPLTIRQCADRLIGAERALAAAGHDPREALEELAMSAMNARSGASRRPRS